VCALWGTMTVGSQDCSGRDMELQAQLQEARSKKLEVRS
jgi:hypothetical protein